MLDGKRILLVIGGGVAAYKSLDLIRRLRERGARVRVALTPAAQHFVTPLSAASLSGEKVYMDLFSLMDEAEMGHIQLSREADLVVVAPATADIMAKLANGLANDLASTLLLATDKRTLVAPSMNVRMWTHAATARNVARLQEDGVLFVGPGDGAMACGEFGPGRMAEPLEIVDAIQQALSPANVLPDVPDHFSLKGRRVIVTSGPTHEPLDPVRYIANRSSGRQGHAIAQAAARAGAHVTLVAGPVAICDPAGVTTVHVETALEMMDAVSNALPADLFIGAAAVADWRAAAAGQQKMKKSGSGAPQITLAENPDILAKVASLGEGRPKLVVGFAAETEHVIDHARAKLGRKRCDLIVANDVSEGTGVMGGSYNTVHLVTVSGVDSWPKMDKESVARELIRRCASMLNGGGAT
ncbi:MAG: bifunctional phosphopantothenoylcysteine decarboxylase/phosphopantothenate synthase [Hyphomicrobiales bacterium]|nr:bifunctional phosphopantothenoylcysteine decarboxylase/phosphopantothenate synthase [Hyphomicrobiales bacterium]